MDDMLEDLTQHLAYHAAVGYAECRDMDAQPLPEVTHDLVRDTPTYCFAVVHAGRTFRVQVEEA